MIKKLLIFVYLLIASFVSAQTFYSNGAVLHVSNGADFFCNGGITLSNSSQVINNGNLTATKNSSFSQAGNFELNSNSTVSGDGVYSIEQDWINDAVFNGDNGEVILFGNTEQIITSTNGTITVFNDLTLIGNGTNQNRKKTLLNTDSGTGINGVLNINDRELNTDVNSFTVDNISIGAVLNSTTLYNEGIVSSLLGGYLIRKTNQASDYLFPVGSSDGVRRYRPVIINPNATTQQVYGVRMNNYTADVDGYFLSQHENSIDEINDLFFHSINRFAGNSNSDIKLFYMPTDDNNWMSFAHWYPTQKQWEDVKNVTENNIPDFNYILKSSWGFPSTETPYVLVNTSDKLNIPNVFTPNGDGINDLFMITSSGLTDYEITIVNRWGELVFQSNDPKQGWDGTSKGKKCTDGVYFYSIKAKQNSDDINKHGHLTISGN